MLRPQAAGDAQPKASKAQKTAAAEAVLQAAHDSTQPEPTPGKEEKKAKEKVTPGVWSDPDARPTVEQLRAAVKAKSEAGHRDALKKLLTEYGAANVTALAQEHYADFLAKVNEL